MSEHGTLTSYAKRKCRCNLCRASWAVYHGEYMASNPDQRQKHRRREAARYASRLVAGPL